MITRATLSTIEQGLPKYRSMLAGNAAYRAGYFDSISTVTASGGETTITFSSIPQTYEHLQLRIHANVTAGFANNNNMNIKVNPSTNNSYFSRLRGNSSTITASQDGPVSYIGPGDIFPSTFQTNEMGVIIADFYNYTSTTLKKSAKLFSGAVNSNQSYVQYDAGIVNLTTAITSILIEPQYSFGAGSVLALYGVAN